VCSRKVGFFQEPQARFYAGELLLALSHLHEHSIVHRDLKPENLLLNKGVHLILTDFGCAKEAGVDVDVDGMSTTSFTGTEAYMAPEIVELLLATKDGEPVEGDNAATRELREKRSYGIAVDWWAYGCLLHQMLTGDIPFYANNIKTMRKNILSAKLKFAKFLSPDAVSLLKQLLVADPTKRLGSDIRKENVPRSPGTVAAGGIAVRSHDFFDGAFVLPSNCCVAFPCTILFVTLLDSRSGLTRHTHRREVGQSRAHGADAPLHPEG
jgi:serine/threonine protein kinase